MTLSETSTIEKSLRDAESALRLRSPSPELDAGVLLAHVLGCARIYLVAHNRDLLTTEQRERFLALVARRAKGEPVAYLVGEREFFGRPFYVSPAVLIPRPETELLVERALEYARACGARRVLDLGTGSGCIAITLAAELTQQGMQVEVCGVDRSREALACAARNAERHGVSLSLFEGSWFDPVQGSEPFDLVVANPPYIAEGDLRRSPETDFEPPQALFSGAEGLDDLRAILSSARAAITTRGAVLLEIGSEQGEVVSALARARGFTATVLRDLAGMDRVVECHVSSERQLV